MKPTPTRWFEALTARENASRLAEALARTGVVQIEATREATVAPDCEALPPVFAELDRLAERYRPYWPDRDPTEPNGAGAPEAVARRALERLQAWSKDADPIILELERLTDERSQLVLLAELLDAGGDELPDVSGLAAAGPTLHARVHVMPHLGRRRLELPARTWLRRVDGPEHTFLICLDDGLPSSELDALLSQRRARPLVLPRELLATTSAPAETVARRLKALDEQRSRALAELETCHARHRLEHALADLARLRWFSTQIPRLSSTRHFAALTGWTTDASGELLRQAIEASAVPALLHFPPPPADSKPPIVLTNARWIRPFETFPGLLGTVAENEPDPSWPLAVIAPLLFGFMFGDVGQGLVLIGLGLLLRKRVPTLRLLIPGGAAAVGFGIVFGTVFTREDLFPPLWVHPLARPLDVLAASISAGAIILIVGLLLSGLRAYWQRSLAHWLAKDAATVLIYVCLLGALFDVRALALAAIGALWHVLGSTLIARRAAEAGKAIGELLEQVLQLLVNTVSFSRVGAFALAHAGLSSAIVSLALAADHTLTRVLILIVGNAFTILLEGLLVSIQTTRLVLFEFFVRFLHGEGRAFQPLTPPTRLSTPNLQRGAQP